MLKETTSPTNSSFIAGDSGSSPIKHLNHRVSEWRMARMADKILRGGLYYPTLGNRG